MNRRGEEWASEPVDGADVARRLAAMVAVLAVAALNRKLGWAGLNTPVLGPLRVRDALVMLLFTPVVLLQCLALFRRLGGLRSRLLTVFFAIGAYLTGVGFGMHEPFNRLRGSLAPLLTAELNAQLAYLDDALGHWIFFAGFTCLCLAGVGAELRAGVRTGRGAAATAALAGLVLAGIVFANMWRENAAQDLTVMAGVCIATAALQLRYTGLRCPPPLTLTIYLGFGGGTVATLVAWLVT